MTRPPNSRYDGRATVRASGPFARIAKMMWATLIHMSVQLAEEMENAYHRHNGRRPETHCTVCGNEIPAGNRRQINLYGATVDFRDGQWVLDGYAEVEYRCERHRLPTE